MGNRMQNTSIFRAANETLKERLAALEVYGRIPFVCECSDSDCLAIVEVTREAYDTIRADDRHFFMLAGHDNLATEDIVGRGNGYIVTETHAAA